MQDCDRASRPQTCILLSPRPPREMNARETEYQRHRQCPESAKINIIPSVLWNSRPHRHLSASPPSIFVGQKPAEKALPGVRFHNTDYVNCAPEEVCEGLPFELPGEAAAGKGLAAVAGPSPALCQPRAWQRNQGPNFPNSSTTAQPRITLINPRRTSPASTSVLREHPAALCPSGGSLRL